MELDDIYKDLAKKYNVHPKVIERVIRVVFLFVRDTMREGTKNKPETFKSVFISGWGTFFPNLKKLERYKRKSEQYKFKQNKWKKKDTQEEPQG